MITFDAPSYALSATTPPITHGGNLHAASERFGIPYETWLDLSTGINPHGYPVTEIPATIWNRLPEDDDGLAEHATRYYGAPHVLPVAGSQAAIRTLPYLLPRGRVGIAVLGYSEYAPAFARAGHTVVPLTPADFTTHASTLTATSTHTLDHLVVVNPNNPDGRLIPPAKLHAWHRDLAARGGTLLVDEAFIDCQPDQSVAYLSAQPGCIVLRSTGKFFGLAGARIGFVLAAPAVLTQLRTALGHWTVNGPARWITAQAMADTGWQTATRTALHQAGARLGALLRQHGLPARDTALFSWIPGPMAAIWQTALARHAIWTRCFAATERLATPDDVSTSKPGSGLAPDLQTRPGTHADAAPDTAPCIAPCRAPDGRFDDRFDDGLDGGLRIGLPGDEAAWTRLETALATLPRSTAST